MASKGVRAMAIELVGTRNRRENIRQFSVCPDSDTVILRGAPEEAAGALFSGKVVLELGRMTSIRAIRLSLTGERKILWPYTNPENERDKRVIKKTDIVYEHFWSFLPASKSYDLAAGVHEFPFSVVLPGSTPETIEGLTKANLKYRLKAECVRNWPRDPIVSFADMRLVRTLLPSAIEHTQTLTVESIWPGKVHYSIVIPQKAVVYGAYIPVEVKISPIVKGLSPGQVHCTVRESLVVKVEGVKNQLNDERDILQQYLEELEMQSRDPESMAIGLDNTGFERWTVRGKLHLPRSLYECVQDARAGCMKVKHKVKFAIHIRNADGHISELKASIPVQLYISPNFLPNRIGLLDLEPPQNVEEIEELPQYVARSTVFYDAPVQLSSRPASEHGTITPYPFSLNSSLTDLRSSASSLAGPSRPTSSGTFSEAEDYFMTHNISSNSTSTSRGHTPIYAHPGLEISPTTVETLRRLCRVPSYSTAVRSLTSNGVTREVAPAYTERPSTRPMPRRLQPVQGDISALIPRNNNWTAVTNTTSGNGTAAETAELPKNTGRDMVAMQETVEE